MIFLSARSRQKRPNLENSTTLRSFEELFKETADVFLKTPFGERVQLFLNCKISRKVYKKVSKHLDNKKNFNNFKTFCRKVTYKIVNFLKHSASLLRNSEFLNITKFVNFIKISLICQTTGKICSFSTILGSF